MTSQSADGPQLCWSHARRNCPISGEIIPTPRIDSRGQVLGQLLAAFLSNSRSMGYVLFPSKPTNQVSGQWPPSGAAPFEKETLVEDRRYRGSLRGKELSSSLLGTWAHFANGSSRSRLCRTWLRNAGSSPVGGTFGGQETCDEFLKFQVRSAPPCG